MPGPDVLGLVAAVFIASAVEVVEGFTIVLAMGITRGWRSALSGTLAALAALAAALVVTVAGILVRRPLAMVPENAMKYAVGVLLTSFGLFWAVEGLGYFAPAGKSLEWPGGTWALVAILLLWLGVSRITVMALRGLGTAEPATPVVHPEESRTCGS